MKEYNIALSASKEYSPYAKVLMNSFYKMHPNSKVNVYLFYLDSSIKKLESSFVKIAKKYNILNTVEFINIDYSKIEVVDNKKGWAVDLWCRWYLLDYLVDICDRVLILGVDTMIQKNIENFYFQDLTGYYFSSCSDMWINNSNSDSWPLIKADMEKFNLLDKSKYTNGDVVLVNLKETKDNLSFNQFLNLFAYNQFTCWDQDIINYCFNDKIKFGDYLKYNYFPNLGIESINDREEYKNAHIIHFAGGPKPWNIPICVAKKFNAIPEWWSIAKEARVTITLPYLNCLLLLSYSYLKGLVKRIKKLNIWSKLIGIIIWIF
jgi:lipopolysaccharide biosynthesis glycosyltransferase